MSRRDCDEIRALLPAHLDGDLAPPDAARVGGHLGACPSCREHLATMRLAVDALRRLPELPPPASILAGVRARLRPVPWHRRLLARRPWLAGVPVGALATALVAVGVALFQARYPRLPQVATEQAAPPGVTRETVRDAAPAPAVKPAPRPAVETARKPAAAPAPQARPAAPLRREQALEPRLVVPGDSQPSPGSGHAVVNAPPEPLAGAPAPAPSAAPSAAPPTVPMAESVPTPAPPAPQPRVTSMRTQDAAPPPVPFAVPEPAGEREQAVTAPRRDASPLAQAISRIPGVQTRPAGEAYLPPGAVRLPGARTTATGEGLRMAGGAEPAPEAILQAPPQAAVPEILEGLTVLLAEEEGLDEIRQLLRRAGARTVELHVLEPGARRAAFAPHRSRAGLRDEVSRGWELTVRMPRSAVAGFAEALERRPGRLVLERRAAPLAARGRPAEEQTLRITVLR